MAFPAAASRAWALVEQAARGRHRPALTACIAGHHRSTSQEATTDPAGRARACGCCAARPGSSGPTSSAPTTADGIEGLDADAVAHRHRVAAARPGVVRRLDGERILITRDALPAARAPPSTVDRDRLRRDRRGVRPHVLVVRLPRSRWSSRRQQVLPSKDPEVAAAAGGRLPAARGPPLQGGPRPSSATERRPAAVTVRCDDGRVGHQVARRCWPSGRSPTATGLGLDAAGVDVDRRRLHPDRPPPCVTNVAHIYAAGDVSGSCRCRRSPPMQGRKIAEHADGPAHPGAPAPRLRQGGLGDLHRAGDRRRRAGRGRRASPPAARCGPRRCRSRRRPRR